MKCEKQFELLDSSNYRGKMYKFPSDLEFELSIACSNYQGEIVQTYIGMNWDYRFCCELLKVQIIRV